MSKRIFIWSFILILTGCSVATPLERKQVIELTFGTFLNPDEFKNEIANPIAKKFPHIKLKHVIVRDKGEPPQNTTVELLHLITGGLITYTDYLIEPPYTAEDLTAWLANQSNPTLNIQQELWNHARMLSPEGAITLIPYTRMLYALYYDPEQFANYGISIPQEPITWETLAYMNAKLPFDRKDWFDNYIVEAMLNQLSMPMIRTSYDEPYIEERLSLIIHVFDQIISGSQGFSYPDTDYNATTLDYVMFLTSHLDEQPMGGRVYTGISPLLSNPKLDLLNFPVHSLDQLVSPTRIEEALRMNSHISPVKKQAALDVISHMVSEEFQVKNARIGLGPVIDSYEAIGQFGEDIPQLENKNLQAFFSTYLASYPEQGQLLSIDLQSGTRHGINGVLRQLLRQEMSSDEALYQLKELFKVFDQ